MQRGRYNLIRIFKISLCFWVEYSTTMVLVNLEKRLPVRYLDLSISTLQLYLFSFITILHFEGHFKIYIILLNNIYFIKKYILPKVYSLNIFKRFIYAWSVYINYSMIRDLWTIKFYLTIQTLLLKK